MPQYDNPPEPPLGSVVLVNGKAYQRVTPSIAHNHSKHPGEYRWMMVGYSGYYTYEGLVSISNPSGIVIIHKTDPPPAPLPEPPIGSIIRTPKSDDVWVRYCDGWWTTGRDSQFTWDYILNTFSTVPMFTVYNPEEQTVPVPLSVLKNVVEDSTTADYAEAFDTLRLLVKEHTQ